MKCEPYARGCSKAELALFTAYLQTSARLTPEQDARTQNLLIGVEILPFAVRAHLIVTDAKRGADRPVLLSRNLSEHSSLNEAMDSLASDVMQRVLARANARG